MVYRNSLETSIGDEVRSRQEGEFMEQTTHLPLSLIIAFHIDDEKFAPNCHTFINYFESERGATLTDEPTRS